MTPCHLAFVAGLAITLAAPVASAGELLGPGIISTELQETSAALTPDGRTLYFMRSDFAEADDTIMVSRREGGRWSTPQVATFSGQWHDSEPTLSPDGQRLYFVSNRPPQSGGAPVTATMNGQHFPGKNLWYVERKPSGGWGAPIHVDGPLNDGAMIYNPSVAANGDIYFSAHRADSGKAYQIYVARDHGHAAPERLPLGDLAHNRMDPAVDPAGRFLLYAGNEGDALGSADIYIVFRQADGGWKQARTPGRRRQQPRAGERAVAWAGVRRAVRVQCTPRRGVFPETARRRSHFAATPAVAAERLAQSLALRHLRRAARARHHADDSGRQQGSGTVEFRAGVVISDELMVARPVTPVPDKLGCIPASQRGYILLNAMPLAP